LSILVPPLFGQAASTDRGVITAARANPTYFFALEFHGRYVQAGDDHGNPMEDVGSGGGAVMNWV
jgi:hypothetical protein